jgi:hypothetical protein
MPKENTWFFIIITILVDYNKSTHDSPITSLYNGVYT